MPSYSQKSMRTIVFNGTGYSLTTLLSEDDTMDPMSFIQNIIDPLAEPCSSNSRHAHPLEFMLRFDNAPISKIRSVLDRLEGCGFSRMDQVNQRFEIAWDRLPGPTVSNGLSLSIDGKGPPSRPRGLDLARLPPQVGLPAVLDTAFTSSVEGPGDRSPMGSELLGLLDEQPIPGVGSGAFLFCRQR
jgi:hypothetical protein